MRPAADSPVVACGAPRFDRARWARRAPVAPDFLACLGSSEAIRQAFARRTLVLVILFDVLEHRAIELPLGLVR